LGDIDGDGHLDLISGSWPGELFLFRGGPDRTFGKPEMLKGKDGKVLLPGGGLKPSGGTGMMLVAGSAKFMVGDDGQQEIELHGERLPVPKGAQVGITGTAASPNLCDWDADGDLDLLVGEIGGTVYLIPNEGTPKAYAYGTPRLLEIDPGTAKPGLGDRIRAAVKGDQPNALRVEGDAGPFAADWDGDGKLDLLCGSGAGGVKWFRNIGSPTEPKLAAGEDLVPAQRNDPSKPATEPQPGARTKLCAADWDGDGKLDLIVGDWSMMTAPKPTLTPDEEKANEAKKAKADALMREYQKEVAKSIGPEASKLSDEERKANTEKTMAILDQWRKARQGLPEEQEMHGWVWFYKRL
jgi:hypothetical protein